jgi:hypothetical protein
MHEPLTYAALDSLLCQLGFAPVASNGTQKVYENTPFQAVIVLPRAKSNASVRPHHLAAVRRTLIEKGIVEESLLEELITDRQLTRA